MYDSLDKSIPFKKAVLFKLFVISSEKLLNLMPFSYNVKQKKKLILIPDKRFLIGAITAIRYNEIEIYRK